MNIIRLSSSPSLFDCTEKPGNDNEFRNVAQPVRHPFSKSSIMNEVRMVGFRRNSREGLLEFSFTENGVLRLKFPVTINHGNVESFRIVV